MKKYIFVYILISLCLLFSACNEGLSEIPESSVHISSEAEISSSMEDILEPVAIIESEFAFFGMAFDLTLDEFMVRFNKQLPADYAPLTNFEIDDTVEELSFQKGFDPDETIYTNPTYISTLENFSLHITTDYHGKITGFSVFSDTTDDLEDLKKWNSYLLDVFGIQLTDNELKKLYDFDNGKHSEESSTYETEGVLRDHIKAYGYIDYQPHGPITSKVAIVLSLYKE